MQEGPAILQTLLPVQYREELSEKKNKNIYYHLTTMYLPKNF
jgi:hypothetical protein